MGIETKAVQEALDGQEQEEALWGGLHKRRSALPYPEKTEFRFFLGCLDNEAERLEYEALLTKSFRCQNMLKKPGDLAVLDMQTSFDKEGRYHVVSRYAILPE